MSNFEFLLSSELIRRNGLVFSDLDKERYILASKPITTSTARNLQSNLNRTLKPMAFHRGGRGASRRGDTSIKTQRSTQTRLETPATNFRGRIQKARSRGRRRVTAAASHPRPQHYKLDNTQPEVAKDTNESVKLPGLEKLQYVLRTKPMLSACSEWSLSFISLAGLETDEDANIITLNLMDYFLFSGDNWLSELSYCNLHATSFLVASLITGKSNTIEQIASALSPDSEFVKMMASPFDEDEDSAVAIRYIIGVEVADVRSGYGLLYERRDQLRRLMGQYADRVENLPVPKSGFEEEEPSTSEQDIDFDTVEE